MSDGMDLTQRKFEYLQRKRFLENGGIMCLTFAESEDGKPVPAKICGNCKWGFSNMGVQVTQRGYITNSYVCEHSERYVTSNGFEEVDGMFIPSDDIKFPRTVHCQDTCEYWEIKTWPKLEGSF